MRKFLFFVWLPMALLWMLFACAAVVALGLASAAIWLLGRSKGALADLVGAWLALVYRLRPL